MMKASPRRWRASSTRESATASTASRWRGAACPCACAMPRRDCCCPICDLLRRRALGHAHEVAGTDPFAEGRLDVAGADREVAPGGDDRLVERQIERPA